FSEDNKIAFLIELKTDLGSRRKKQDDYLIAAADKGLVKLIQGLLEIFRVTNKKRKYFHLFKMLEDAGIIELPSQLQPKVFSKNMSGVMAIMRQVKIITPLEQTKVVYLQPTGDGENVITQNMERNQCRRYRRLIIVPYSTFNILVHIRERVFLSHYSLLKCVKPLTKESNSEV
ncbi:MAG: hypothetical protein ACW968_16865, partial [Candidatus Thorarchaeota archaeon]